MIQIRALKRSGDPKREAQRYSTQRAKRASLRSNIPLTANTKERNRPLISAETTPLNLKCRSTLEAGGLQRRQISILFSSPGPVFVRIWVFEDSFRLPCPCIRSRYYIIDPRSLSFSVISYPFRTRFARHLLYRSSELTG